MDIPDFIVHYSRSRPFLSLTSLSSSEREAVIAEMNETNAWGIARFSDPEYLERRIKIERDMRERFIAMGGQPELEHPIYFFLGRHPKFEERESNKGYRIQLSDLSPDSVSFTYGDSMFCFNEDYRTQSGPAYRSSLCESLYKVDELPDLFSKIPRDGALSVEAQLWRLPSLDLVRTL